MGKKADLIELRQEIYKQLKDFTGNLDEKERAAVGKPDDWAIKDCLIHVALWDERRGHDLQAIGKGEPATDWGAYQDLNAQDFESHRHDSWEQIQALLETAQEAVLVGLEATDDEQMERTDLLPGNQERPLWNRISGSIVMHPLIHMTDYLAKSDRADEALGLVLEISEPMEKLDDGDAWQGLIKYNKACYYALTGQKNTAIDLLGQSLALNPGLVEWSKEDSDLDSLREEPEYKALYTE
jgi:hypothetical protein